MGAREGDAQEQKDKTAAGKSCLKLGAKLSKSGRNSETDRTWGYLAQWYQPVTMPRGPGLALRAQLEGKGCKPGCLCCPVIVRPMVNRCVTSTGCDVPEGAKLQDDDDGT